MVDSAKKIRAARISLTTAVGLAVVKFVLAIFTGSLAVLASAADSLLDILMTGINFLAIRQAEQPADESHPFGHGKFETLATLFQAFFIALSGGWIIYESIRRIFKGSELAHLGSGIAVLLFGTAVSGILGRYLKKIGRETDSSALQADSLHYTMDVYTGLGLVAGLTLVTLLDAPWLDPILSMLVAGYILWEAAGLVRHGMRDLLDEELPATVREEVTRLIEAHQDQLHGFHNLRTRRAGSQKIMDFHLTVCRHLSVEEAHGIADELEKKIQREIRGSDVTIHIEPCREARCPGQEACPGDKTRFETPTDS